MEALLGVAFVAQLRSQQAEVYFQYPPTGATSSPNNNSAPSREVSEQCGNDGFSPKVPGPLIAERPRVCSEGDLAEKRTEVFGIPSMIFAKLMLPEMELCNRPFFLEMDAGHRQGAHKHDHLSHLHFVSFPFKLPPRKPKTQSGSQEERFLDGGAVSFPEMCQKLADQNLSEADLRHHWDSLSPTRQNSQEAPSTDRQVVSINIVHVLDSRRTGRQDAHTSTLWEVSAHLSRALLTEEEHESYLIEQINCLASAQQNYDHVDTVLAKSSLARLLRDMTEGVKERGYKTLWVNGCLLCQVCVFPKHEAPAPPSADNALALLCSREDLLHQLPLDSAEIVHRVIVAACPQVSLGELMVRLALPLATLQRVAQHLVYWKKARVLEVLQDETRVTVARSLITVDSALEESFERWYKKNKRQSELGHRVTLSETIQAFSKGRSLKQVRTEIKGVDNNNNNGVDFDRLLEWLVAEDLLVQLGTFCRFLPSRASRTGWYNINEVKTNVKKRYLHIHFNEDDLRLLATRAGDDDESDQRLRFLCGFVVDFACAHVRIDGCGFAAWAADCFHDRVEGSKKARKLLEANKDIFVQYVCRC